MKLPEKICHKRFDQCKMIVMGMAPMDEESMEDDGKANAQMVPASKGEKSVIIQ